MLARQSLLRTRCLGVATATTGVAGALTALLAPGLAAPVPTVDEALVRLCLVALLGAVAWAWLATISVVAAAWRGRPAHRHVPTPLRRAVLLCCGVALVTPIGLAGLVGSASADEHRSPATEGIAGLPMPERATGPAHARPRAGLAVPTVTARTVVVAPGDSLWALAAADLPEGASTARITATWRAIHRRNVDVIGRNPDLIRPGQRLVIPPR